MLSFLYSNITCHRLICQYYSLQQSAARGPKGLQQSGAFTSILSFKFFLGSIHINDLLIRMHYTSSSMGGLCGVRSHKGTCGSASSGTRVPRIPGDMEPTSQETWTLYPKRHGPRIICVCHTHRRDPCLIPWAVQFSCDTHQ